MNQNKIGKNLFDPQKIRNSFEEIRKDATILFIEVNSFTLEYLKNKGICSIDDELLIVNDNLLNYQAKVYYKKFNELTEYGPYIYEPYTLEENNND